MSQTGLAKALGLHPSAINKVVSGKRQLKSTRSRARLSISERMRLRPSLCP
ncbi:helix-turn-helix domain-containing protein [Rhizobium leguminosarum]|uniref:helix-turn-helix domain-containing protein n=1 Tax=Rhizobium leguminosarum TaxID=384 RepID=UPI00315A64FE